MAEEGKGSVGRITQFPIVCSEKGLQSSEDLLREIQTRSADGEIDQHDLLCIVRKAKAAIMDDRKTVESARYADAQIELAQHFTRAIRDPRNTDSKLARIGITTGRRMSKGAA